MRIGIDARTILNPEKGEAIGVGHYTYQLIRHLLKIDNENEYVIFFDFRVREKDVKKFTKPNVKIKFYPYSDYKKYLPGVYNEILGAATLQKEKLDVLHTTSPMSRIQQSYDGKTIVTFHDMGAFSTPECYPSMKRARTRVISKLMAKKAERVVAASNAIKTDLEKYLQVPSEKIDVIYSGIDRRFFEQPSEGAQKLLSHFGIEKKYILFLGTIEPSKNISRLLSTFAKFKEARKAKNGGSCEYQLVLAGKRGWQSQQIQEQVKELKLSKDVVFTGYVIGDELVPLFRGAEFFIMPSLYEGFGMTVLEAFATETPTILSKIPTLEEVGDGGAYFVDPMNVGEMAEALEKFATDEQFRKSYCQKGLERARMFDWEKTARETLAIYEKVAKK